MMKDKISNINTGLSSSDLNNIISVISSNIKINEIVLFGSRAKGSYHNGSDIDFALKGEKINLNDIIDISIELDILELPYKIDLVIFDRINETSLIDHIQRVGINLYTRQSPVYNTRS